jgi:PAS domain S-box-containing protein
MELISPYNYPVNQSMRAKRTKKRVKKTKAKKPRKQGRSPVGKAGGRVKKTLRPARKHLDVVNELGDLPICERLAHLLTRTSVVIYAAKPGDDYGATFISYNVQKMTGYKNRSFINRPKFWFNHIHPDDRERVLSEIEHVFENDYYEYEYRFKHKKGHYIWMHDEMRLIRDSKGNPVEIVGYWTDITKRKELEIEVGKRSKLISDFMESASEGFALIDSKFNIIDVNRFLLDRFGVKREDALKMNYFDISDVAYESGRYEEYLEILETGRPRYYPDLVLPPVYGEKHVAAHVFKVGNCLGLIIKEVTDDIKRQKDLEESEAHFQALLGSNNAGVIFQDPDGAILRVNEKACEILDISESEFLGSKLIDVCSDLVDEHGDKLGIDDYPVARVLRTGKPVQNVKVGMPAEEASGMRWFLVNAEPVLDPETGIMDVVLCYFVDITEQKYVEDQLTASEERYRQIFENCPIGIGISDTEGKVVTANEAMQRITGYSLSEFKKINLVDTFVNSEERDHMIKILREQGYVSNYRVRLLRRDGTPYDAVLNISRIEIGGKVYNHTMCHVAAS